MGNSKKRGKAPSPLTILMLCAAAAGRCEFDGCNEPLFKDPITLKEFNNSNVAHIIAASPDGPRGNAKLSEEFSDSIDNLMLLCPKCHHLIDSQEKDYPVEKLREMKRKHENLVRMLCDSINLDTTELVLFMSPIKNKNQVNISAQAAASAVYPKRKIASQYGLPSMFRSSFNYATQEYWYDIKKQIDTWFNTSIKAICQMNPTIHFSVFPLAPIPSILYLGYLFGDKLACDVYQHFRYPDTWSWQSQQATNEFSIKFETTPVKSSSAALIVSLTADIALDRVRDIYDPSVICTISALHHGVNCINSLEDLSAFWHCYQEACDNLKNNYTMITEVGIFISAPVSAAFEMGRRFMPDVYLPMIIFDECDGFKSSIRIGGKSVD